jgi:fatty acid desaturase
MNVEWRAAARGAAVWRAAVWSAAAWRAAVWSAAAWRAAVCAVLLLASSGINKNMFQFGHNCMHCDITKDY